MGKYFYKKEDIALGIIFAGAGIMLIGFFIAGIESITGHTPFIIGISTMIVGTIMIFSSLVYLAINGKL